MTEKEYKDFEDLCRRRLLSLKPYWIKEREYDSLLKDSRDTQRYNLGNSYEISMPWSVDAYDILPHLKDIQKELDELMYDEWDEEDEDIVEIFEIGETLIKLLNKIKSFNNDIERVKDRANDEERKQLDKIEERVAKSK